MTIMGTNSLHTTKYYYTRNKNIINTVYKYVLNFSETFEIDFIFDDNQK